MPVHDWTVVDSGVFHDFHQRWIISICNALNDGLLPDDYYAMAEQVTSGAIPDVVTLERVARANDQELNEASTVSFVSDFGLPLSMLRLKRVYNHEADLELYAARSTHVVIRHVSGDRVVGFIEIVSPGNKHSAIALRNFHRQIERRDACRLPFVGGRSASSNATRSRGVHAKFWEEAFGDASAPGVDAVLPAWHGRIQFRHAACSLILNHLL